MSILKVDIFYIYLLHFNIQMLLDKIFRKAYTLDTERNEERLCTFSAFQKNTIE